MTVYTTDPKQRYDGPDFEEYCIDRAGYLPATRDRTPCVGCALQNLCQAGFDEQVRRVIHGQDPSLTNGVEFAASALTMERLLVGLSPEAAEFVTAKVGRLTERSLENEQCRSYAT